MITVYVRSSFLGSWEFCQLKTYINYCLGIEEESGKKAVLGTMVHKVLELLALCKLREQNNNKKDIDDDAVGKLTIDFPWKTNIGMESLIEKVFGYYSNKSKRCYEEADFNIVKEWCYMAITHQNGNYDPRNQQIFAAEKHFDIELAKPWSKYTYTLNNQNFDGNVRIKGTIDLITSVNGDTIEVIDYKTGSRKNWATGKTKEYSDLCEDKQLMLYYYALKTLYPDKNILFTIFFIRDGGPFTLCFDEEHIKKTEVILKDTLEKVWKTD